MNDETPRELTGQVCHAQQRRRTVTTNEFRTRPTVVSVTMVVTTRARLDDVALRRALRNSSAILATLEISD